MPDPANVFDGAPAPVATTTVTPPTTSTPNDAYANLLGAIKNEQGAPKYDSVEKALEALKHSQEYIPSLKTELEKREEELAGLRANKERYENLEAIVQRLTATKEPNGEGQPPATKGLDEQAVSELVKRTLAETEMTRKANDNFNKVQNALVAKFKDKASDVVKQKAAELGVTTKELEELAKKSPVLTLQLFNTKAGETPSATSTDFNSSLQPTIPAGIKPPEKSLLSGASSKEVSDYFSKLKQDVYRKHDIT